MNRKGWRGETGRHSLAARGIRTNKNEYGISRSSRPFKGDEIVSIPITSKQAELLQYLDGAFGVRKTDKGYELHGLPSDLDDLDWNIYYLSGDLKILSEDLSSKIHDAIFETKEDRL